MSFPEPNSSFDLLVRQVGESYRHLASLLRGMGHHDKELVIELVRTGSLLERMFVSVAFFHAPGKPLPAPENKPN